MGYDISKTDEVRCLDGKTDILTNKGKILISDIVNKKLDVKVASLNEKSYYIIHGKLISRIYSIDKFRLLVGRNTRIYTPFFGVRKSDYYSERYEVSLGMMHYQIDSISQFINY